MNILPTEIQTSYRTGTLQRMERTQIISVLGFPPNAIDDEDKVVDSWSFTVDGKECAIWDYKGSHKMGQYSTFGPATIFLQLFPDSYVTEMKET